MTGADILICFGMSLNKNVIGQLDFIEESRMRTGQAAHSLHTIREPGSGCQTYPSGQETGTSWETH